MLFRASHPTLPPALEIRHADFFDELHGLAAESLDGIFFDPALPSMMWNDQSVWDAVMPQSASSRCASH